MLIFQGVSSTLAPLYMFMIPQIPTFPGTPKATLRYRIRGAQQPWGFPTRGACKQTENFSLEKEKELQIHLFFRVFMSMS